MGMTFIPNPLFTREIAAEPPMGLFLKAQAEEVKAGAESVSPVDTGLYKASFDTSVEETSEGFKGIVSNSAPYALFVEFGTEDTPVFAPLRTGLEKAGLKRK